MARDEAGGRPHGSGASIVLARIGRPHGLKGWVRLNSFTSPPENVLSYSSFSVLGGAAATELEIDASSNSSGSLLVHFKGCDNPEAARQLTGLELAVRDDELPQLPPGQFYWHQLQGLTVVNRQQACLGTVERLLETGANDVLVVVPQPGSVDQRQRLIPYLPESVLLKVDLESQLITVDWDPDYLE